MYVNFDHLPEASVIIALALVGVTFLIALLRGLRKVLVILAAVIIVGWGFFFYSKHKDFISSIDLPDIQIIIK